MRGKLSTSLGIVAALWIGGCSGASRTENTLAGAGVTAGIAVAAAAVNRAATDECWGNCSHGFLCDKAAGVCVPAGELAMKEPYHPDPEDDRCIVEDDGEVLCPDDPDTEAGAEEQPAEEAP